MKKKRLNKRGKVLVTSLTIMLSVVIYILMAILGAKGQANIFYQVVLICGWTWMLFGQTSIYAIIWGGIE